MFCPKCHSEYRSEFSVCSDCGIALIAELPLALITEPDHSIWAPETLDSPDTLQSLQAEFARIYWADSSFVRLSAEYDSLVLEITQSNDEALRIIFVGHTAFQQIGHWDENIIESAAVTDDSPLIAKTLDTILSHYGEDVKKTDSEAGGATSSNGREMHFPGPWFCMRLVFIDGCELQVVFQKLEINKL